MYYYLKSGLFIPCRAFVQFMFSVYNLRLCKMFVPFVNHTDYQLSSISEDGFVYTYSLYDILPCLLSVFVEYRLLTVFQIY